MRNYFFALFVLSTLALNAQTSSNDVLKDSSWIVNRSGLFFQARQTLTTNGTETVVFAPIGDTLTTAMVFTTNIQSEANRMAGDANILMRYRSAVTELLRFGREIPLTIKGAPLDSIAKTEPNLYDVGYWTLNGQPIRFRRTAQGNFQWRADSTTTWRAAGFLGSIIRLNGLNGFTTDLYQVNSTKVYRTINSQYTVRPIGSSQRTALAPPPEEEKELPEPPPYKLNTDGTITTTTGTFKYNTRKKQWDKI